MLISGLSLYSIRGGCVDKYMEKFYRFYLTKGLCVFIMEVT
jgi:hypothetical protein